MQRKSAGIGGWRPYRARREGLDFAFNGAAVRKVKAHPAHSPSVARRRWVEIGGRRECRRLMDEVAEGGEERRSALRGFGSPPSIDGFARDCWSFHWLTTMSPLPFECIQETRDPAQSCPNGTVTRPSSASSRCRWRRNSGRSICSDSIIMRS